MQILTRGEIMISDDTLSAIKRLVLVFTVSVWGAIAAVSTSPAQTVNTGRKITLAIGTSVGGGYDLYGRLASRHLGRMMKGNPTLIATNIPGAGQLIMTNWLYNVAPRDGSTIGLVPSTTAFEALFGNQQANFDARQFGWIGSLNGHTAVAVSWYQSPVKTANDLFSHAIIGGGAPSSDVTIWPRLINSILGTRIQLVAGYVGTSQIALAMESGEVHGLIGADWDGIKISKPDWVASKRIHVLMQLRDKRTLELPEVPTILEFTKTEEQQNLVQLFIDRLAYGRPLATPPGVQTSVLEEFRVAFGAMIDDAEFRKDAATLGATIEPKPGNDILDLVKRVYTTDPALLARATQELRFASQ
jgi:tripartite-type tricarboxylate transporter receptor subunit TctC